jgi:uncharacterized protein YjeT (DUF2065 family)
MDLKFLLCVIGLLLIIEGLPYAAFPFKMKGWLRQIMEVPENNLRVVGFAAMVMGLLLVYIGRS